MAFCGNCGTEVAGAAFCPKCGQAQGGSAPAGQTQTGGPVTQTTQSSTGLDENVAGLLCYVLGWVTGIIFFLIDKRPYVRFHAAQSIVVFGGLHVIEIAVGIIFGAGFMMTGGFGTFGMAAALYSLISLVAVILWILLMVKAYQGEKFMVPVAGGIAQSFAGK
jgi:uncharacterized membrane protein